MIAQTQWLSYQRDLPNDRTNLPFNIVRSNVWALAALAAASGIIVPGWNYTNSVVRSEGTPGTAALPARRYAYIGTGNLTRWVKTACTYTGTDLTKAAFYYSEDNESTYVPMIDVDGNYVRTYTYDTHNIQTAVWGNTP